MSAGWTTRWTRGARAALLLGGLLAGTAGVAAAQAASDDGVSVVWLVRHAERADDGMGDQPDPELSAPGRVRAAELARLLGDAGITSIHSTPFRRTRQTAAPLAEALGLEVQAYDPRDPAAMEAFLARLAEPGRHVVVGHSNTTPDLVRRLGGDPVSPIDEMEYDRIYVVTRGPDGSITSSLLRFGAPAPGG
ncbi:MAG: phosphoglycerate mutase family protein [Longimicrobiales bacterium]